MPSYQSMFTDGLTRNLYPQSAKRLPIHLGEHDCRMGLAAIETWQLAQCLGTTLIALTQDRQRHQHLVGMQARVMPLQVGNLRVLYGGYQLLGQQAHRVVYARQMFGCID